MISYYAWMQKKTLKLKCKHRYKPQFCQMLLDYAVGFYTTNYFFPVNHSITTKIKDIALGNVNNKINNFWIQTRN